MTTAADERPAVRAPVFGRELMVVTGHQAATMAAVAAHKRGGSVIDAAIAASAALATVAAQATSIGGDCFWLHHDAATGRTHALNASGVAPAAATPARFADGMHVRGPLAAVVPGLVRAWDEMHRRFGRLGWSTLFDDAIGIADGHPVSYVLATRIPEMTDTLAADPGCAALYLPGGRAIGVGDTLHQPQLAATLRAIADKGADEFYSGALAGRIAAGFERAGGLVTAADLAAYRPLWVEPMSTEYRGHRVSVMPPNSCGALLLVQLNGLSALSSTELLADPARTVGWQMSAMKAAFRLGVPHIADPSAVPNAPADLLSPAMTRELQAAVRAQASAGSVPGSGGTACVLVTDAAGNMCCLVQSVYNVFGSTFLDPGTGILYNNRMQDFAPVAGQPNSVGPGRRPFHTLCPILVHRDGRPRFALASPGGISQTLTGVQVLSHLVDRGADVAWAVQAPRWCNRRGGDFLIEPSFPDAIAGAVQAMGHQARRGGDSYFFGSAKAIEWLPSGNLAGAGDDRREAFVLGV